MRNIIILGITSLLTDISSEMVYPLIPLYLIAQLGATPGIVGIIEGIAESIASLLKLYSGHISDKLGKRKPLAISGYSFSGIGKILIYFAGAWPMILFGRIADRLGKGIRTAPRDALIAESTGPQNMGRAFGLHRAMDTAGAAVGVIIAYIIITRYQGSIKPIFLWSLIPAGLGVITLFFVKETKSTIRPKSRKFSLNFKSLPVRLKWFLVVVFIFALGNASKKATFMGLHSTLVGIGLLPASLLTGWLWTFFGPKAAFITGACLGLTAAVFMGILLGRKPSDLESCNQNRGN